MGVFERQRAEESSVDSFLERKKEEQQEGGVFERRRVEQENEKIREINTIAEKYGVDANQVLEWSKKYNLKTIDKSLATYTWIMNNIDKVTIYNAEVNERGEVVSGHLKLDKRDIGTIDSGTVNVYKIGVLDLNLKAREKLNNIVTAFEAGEKKYARAYKLKSAGNVYKEAISKGMTPEEAKAEVERVTGTKESIEVLKKMAATTNYKTKEEKKVEELKKKSGEVFRKTYEAEKYIEKRQEGKTQAEAYKEMEEEIPGQPITERKEAEQIFVNYSKEMAEREKETQKKENLLNEQYRIYFEQRFEHGKTPEEAYTFVSKKFGEPELPKETFEEFFNQNIEETGGGYYSPASRTQIREALLKEGYTGYSVEGGKEVIFKVKTSEPKEVLDGLIKATITSEISKEQVVKEKEKIMEELKKDYLEKGHSLIEWEFRKEDVYNMYLEAKKAREEYKKGLLKYQEKYTKPLVDVKKWLNEQAEKGGATFRSWFKLKAPEENGVVEQLAYQGVMVARETGAFVFGGEILGVGAQAVDVTSAALTYQLSGYGEKIEIAKDIVGTTEASIGLGIQAIRVEPQTALSQIIGMEAFGVGIGKVVGKAKAGAFAKEFKTELGTTEFYADVVQQPIEQNIYLSAIKTEQGAKALIETVGEKGTFKSTMRTTVGKVDLEAIQIGEYSAELTAPAKKSGAFGDITKGKIISDTQTVMRVSSEAIKKYVGEEDVYVKINKMDIADIVGQGKKVKTTYKGGESYLKEMTRKGRDVHNVGVSFDEEGNVVGSFKLKQIGFKKEGIMTATGKIREEFKDVYIYPEYKKYATRTYFKTTKIRPKSDVFAELKISRKVGEVGEGTVETISLTSEKGRISGAKSGLIEIEAEPKSLEELKMFREVEPKSRKIAYDIEKSKKYVGISERIVGVSDELKVKISGKEIKTLVGEKEIIISDIVSKRAVKEYKPQKMKGYKIKVKYERQGVSPRIKDLVREEEYLFVPKEKEIVFGKSIIKKEIVSGVKDIKPFEIDEWLVSSRSKRVVKFLEELSKEKPKTEGLPTLRETYKLPKIKEEEPSKINMELKVKPKESAKTQLVEEEKIIPTEKEILKTESKVKISPKIDVEDITKRISEKIYKSEPSAKFGIVEKSKQKKDSISKIIGEQRQKEEIITIETQAKKTKKDLSSKVKSRAKLKVEPGISFESKIATGLYLPIKQIPTQKVTQKAIELKKIPTKEVTAITKPNVPAPTPSMVFPIFVIPKADEKKQKEKKKKKKKKKEYRQPDLFGMMFKTHKDITYKGILPRNPMLVGEEIVKPRKRRKKKVTEEQRIEEELAKMFGKKKKKRRRR